MGPVYELPQNAARSGLENLLVETAPPPSKEMATLRAMMFPELADDALFDAFLALCKARGLNPWCRQVRPKIMTDEGGSRRVELMLSIEGFRLIAHRTGLYAGIDADTFTYDDDGRVTSATSTVYRLVAGARCGFTAVVRWAEYAGIQGTKDVVAFREAMPHVWLSKCGEAAALRKAFAQELSGIYTPEEMAAVDARRSLQPIPRRASDLPIVDDDYSQLPDEERLERRMRIG